MQLPSVVRENTCHSQLERVEKGSADTRTDKHAARVHENEQNHKTKTKKWDVFSRISEKTVEMTGFQPS